ncbi:hypothetical protein [Pseudonocardia sp. WMMC193]|uniref:hypothetical protein n=1 Tax=Pseudonocardia sp. WMMC193 TaxID=2911965 RepID=UPI001F4320B3|nr:hypothetical protein [Pseudonocardia sp. WMMC193]MCF7548166.1 hypothetical protein [Pseudonocardia sp. WMMC193]
MTEEQFASAAATAFGREPLAAITALAREGAPAFDAMREAVGRQGGAAEVAAAKMQGLGGAMESFRSNLETVAISIYEVVDGPLEQLVRAATEGLDVANDLIAGKGLPGGGGALGAAIENVEKIINNLRVAAQPAADGVRKLIDSFREGNGATSAAGAALTVFTGALELASRLLGPIGSVVGGILSVFSALPGPVQAAALAFLGFKAAGSYLDNLRAKTTPVVGDMRQVASAAQVMNEHFARTGNSMRIATDSLTAGGAAARAAGTGLDGAATSSSRLIRTIDALKPDALIRFNQEARVQQQLAQASGESVSRLGAYYAVAQQRAQGFTDAVRTQRDAAAGAGTSISTLGASMQVLGDRSATIGRATDAFTNMRDRVIAVGSAADGTHGKFTALAGGIAGVGAAGGSLVATGIRGLINALGGPWGIVIGAASVAMALFGQRQQEAAQRAQELAARQEALKGTLEQTTGAITDATRQDIAAEAVQSGRAKTVGALGVSTKLYVDALTGQSSATQLVTEAVNRGNTSLLEQDSSVQALVRSLGKYGITLEDVNAASLGNEGATNKVRAAMQEYTAAGGESVSVLGSQFNKAKELASANREVLASLVATNEMLNKSKEELLATQQAADVFAASLKLITDGGVFEGLAKGGPLLDAARDQLDKMGASAQRSAFEIGKNSERLGGIDGAVAKGVGAMQNMRDQFIQNATAAGLTAEKARELADSAGLIPAVTEFQIRTNANEATTQLFQVNEMVKGIPPGKTVTVNALTQEARTQLEAMGFTVKTLPNGQIEITANTEAAKTELQSTITFAQTASATMKFDADTIPVDGKIKGTIDFGNGSSAKMTLNAEDGPANGTIKGVVDYGNGQKATITLNGNRVNADGTINAVVDYGNGRVAVIKVDANAAAANAAIDNAARRRIAYIDVVTRGGGSAPVGNGVRINHDGGILRPMHNGGVLNFARGGLAARKLTPMRSGFAEFVKPNTWRVVGDRMKDDEAYIPINSSVRSRRIFEETARRMGYNVARAFHDGGIARRVSRATNTQRVVASIDIGAMAQEVARLITKNPRDINVHMVANNPVAETGAETITRNMRTLGAMGAFG